METMIPNTKLFVPGPCDVDDDVLEAMSWPVRCNYGREWMPIYTEIIGLLKQVFQTQSDVFMVPGSGSAGLDMALGSLLEAGQKVVVGHNGFWGERLVAIAERNGLDVVHVSAPLGQPLDPNDLRRALCDHPDAPLVILAHHETATTVMNPLRELAQVTHEAGRLIVADAISSLGGVNLPVDEWGIDVCVTASNKCLETPPGLALVSVSPHAWEMVDSHAATRHSWYLDLRTWREYAQEWGGWHPTPVTMPTNNVMALHASVKKILAVGLTAHFAKHVRACQAVRAGLRNLGCELFVPDEFAAPTATAARPRPEFTVGELTQWLADHRRILVGGGIHELAGKIFRIGHLGKATTREYLMDLLFAIEEFLRLKGVDLPAGASFVGL